MRTDMDETGLVSGREAGVAIPNDPADAAPPKRTKVSHIGAPACFALEQACKQVRDAFPELREEAHVGIYVVGSCLERADWRDVDVRMMMDDETFRHHFPGVNLEAGTWEFDPRWCLLTVAISQWMSKQTGLPIDFQFQPQTHANKRHKGRRHAAGLKFAKSDS